MAYKDELHYKMFLSTVQQVAIILIAPLQLLIHEIV